MTSSGFNIQYGYYNISSFVTSLHFYSYET